MNDVISDSFREGIKGIVPTLAEIFKLMVTENPITVAIVILIIALSVTSRHKNNKKMAIISLCLCGLLSLSIFYLYKTF